MNRDIPPPIIHSARLLAYAINDDDVSFVDKIKLIVDNRRLGEVPKLAICESLDSEKQALLFFCDAQWKVLGVIAKSSVEDAKQQAEVGYKGLSLKWVDCETPVAKVSKYLKVPNESAFAKNQCSFCEKPSRDVKKLYGTEVVLICNECIEEFYRYLKEDKI